MKTSVDRILTTHVGSLPRGKEVLALLFAQDKGESYDAAQFEAAMVRGVADAVRNQSEAGLDILNDGETSKISYATYTKHRLNGFEIGNAPRATPQDLERNQRYADLVGRERVMAGTDCGFGHFAGFGAVLPAICWAKMQSLAEGARLASKQLWR